MAAQEASSRPSSPSGTKQGRPLILQDPSHSCGPSTGLPVAGRKSGPGKEEAGCGLPHSLAPGASPASPHFLCGFRGTSSNLKESDGAVPGRGLAADGGPSQMAHRKPSRPSPIRQSWRPGCRGRGAGQPGPSWQAAFVLDDFSLKICLKNVLLSKEGEALARHGHRLLSPLNGAGWGVGVGEGHPILSVHRQPFVQQEKRTSDTATSSAAWQEPPGLAGFPRTPSLSVECIKICRFLTSVYHVTMAFQVLVLEMQRGINPASCPQRVHSWGEGSRNIDLQSQCGVINTNRDLYG